MNDMKRIKRVLPLTNATLLRKLNPEISQPGGHIKAAEEMLGKPVIPVLTDLTEHASSTAAPSLYPPFCF
jgi:hypothetical protein